MDTSAPKATKNSKFSRWKGLRKKQDRLPDKLKPYFLKTLAELLDEGFAMNQCIDFMIILLPKQEKPLAKLNQALSQGQSFERAIQPLGFSTAVMAQVFYAQRQGRFTTTLRELSAQLEQTQTFKQQLLKTLSYPLLMSIFLVGLLLVMRTVMLPQMVSFISQDLYDNSFWVRTLINFFTYLPQLMMGLVAGGLLAYLVFDFYLMKLSYLARCRLLVKLPLLRRWVRTVVTHRLCRELGHFFQGGYAIGEIIQILHDYPIDPFLSEVAAQLQTQLLEGVPLGNALENLEVFTTSLPLIIRQGELTSQTGPKCQHYAKKLHQDLVDDISQKLAWVQPILFLIIGALVMAMYLVMLLPALTMDF